MKVKEAKQPESTQSQSKFTHSKEQASTYWKQPTQGSKPIDATDMSIMGTDAFNRMSIQPKKVGCAWIGINASKKLVGASIDEVGFTPDDDKELRPLKKIRLTEHYGQIVPRAETPGGTKMAAVRFVELKYRNTDSDQPFADGRTYFFDPVQKGKDGTENIFVQSRQNYPQFNQTTMYLIDEIQRIRGESALDANFIEYCLTTIDWSKKDELSAMNSAQRTESLQSAFEIIELLKNPKSNHWQSEIDPESVSWRQHQKSRGKSQNDVMKPYTEDGSGSANSLFQQETEYLTNIASDELKESRKKSIQAHPHWRVSKANLKLFMLSQLRFEHLHAHGNSLTHKSVNGQVEENLSAAPKFLNTRMLSTEVPLKWIALFNSNARLFMNVYFNEMPGMNKILKDGRIEGVIHDSEYKRAVIISQNLRWMVKFPRFSPSSDMALPTLAVHLFLKKAHKPLKLLHRIDNSLWVRKFSKSIKDDFVEIDKKDSEILPDGPHPDLYALKSCPRVIDTIVKDVKPPLPPRQFTKVKKQILPKTSKHFIEPGKHCHKKDVHMAKPSKKTQGIERFFEEKHEVIPNGERLTKEMFERSVVRLNAVYRVRDTLNPLNSDSLVHAWGSGVVIEVRGRKLIMTNSHVASATEFMKIRFNSEGKEFLGKIVANFMQHDLAFVAVDDSEFLDKAIPLEISHDLPVGTEIRIIGYPTVDILFFSPTGIISRHKDSIVCQSLEYTNVFTTEIPMNGGNSGGPAVTFNLAKQRPEVVGLVFQGIDTEQNYGECVRPASIRHAIEQVGEAIDNIDSLTQSAQGVPYIKLGVISQGYYHQTFSNIFQHMMATGSTDSIGTVISRVPEGTDCEGILKVGDVILAIDGYSIDMGGDFKEGPLKGRSTESLFLLKRLGESTKFDILRNNQKLSVKVTHHQFRNEHTIAPLPTDPAPASYFGYNGVFFVKEDGNFFTDTHNGFHAARQTFVPTYEILENVPKSLYQCSGVRILKVVNKDIARSLIRHLEYNFVKSINGVPVNSFDELVKALKFTTGKKYIIELSKGGVFSIDSVTKEQNTKIANSERIAFADNLDVERAPEYGLQNATALSQYYTGQKLFDDMVPPKPTTSRSTKRTLLSEHETSDDESYRSDAASLVDYGSDVSRDSAPSPSANSSDYDSEHSEGDHEDFLSKQSKGYFTLQKHFSRDEGSLFKDSSGNYIHDKALSARVCKSVGSKHFMKQAIQICFNDNLSESQLKKIVKKFNKAQSAIDSKTELPRHLDKRIRKLFTKEFYSFLTTQFQFSKTDIVNILDFSDPSQFDTLDSLKSLFVRALIETIGEPSSDATAADKQSHPYTAFCNFLNENADCSVEDEVQAKPKTLRRS